VSAVIGVRPMLDNEQLQEAKKKLARRWAMHVMCNTVPTNRSNCHQAVDVTENVPHLATKDIMAYYVPELAK